MISEFHDLSEKIDQLAALTQSLRTENYLLRQANTILGAENLAFQQRLAEAQRRVEALHTHTAPSTAVGREYPATNSPSLRPDWPGTVADR